MGAKAQGDSSPFTVLISARQGTPVIRVTGHDLLQHQTVFDPMLSKISQKSSLSRTPLVTIGMDPEVEVAGAVQRPA
jgi:hypothetical protein